MADEGSQANPSDEQTDPVAEVLSGARDTVDQLQAELTSLTGDGGGGIQMLADVDLDVSIELGRTEMLLEDVLKLGPGAVVELDKLAGDPVDVFVNGRLVARGEVLVLNDNFCIRVSEIVADVEEQAAAISGEVGAVADKGG